MDLSMIESLIPNVAEWFNVQPVTVMFMWLSFGVFCNLMSRLIPDTATGPLMYLRIVCAFFGAHVQNRIAPGAPANKIMEGLAADRFGPPIEEAVQEAAEEVIPPTDPIEDYLKAVQAIRDREEQEVDDSK